jgi:hypothetical protein
LVDFNSGKEMHPHTRACAVRNGKDLDEYQYDGKVVKSVPIESATIPSASVPSDSKPPFKMSQPEATVPAPSIDAKADIEKPVCELTLEN